MNSASFPWSGVAAVTLWGASFVATRIALQGGIEPVGLVVLRMVMGVGFLLAFGSIRRLALLPRPEDRPRIVLLGLILATHVGLQTKGLAYTSAIHTGWIVAFQPVAIAAGAQRFLGQRLTAAGWLGVLLGLAGVAAVISSDPGDAPEARLGDAIQLATIPTWAAFTILASRPVASSGPLRVTLATMVVAGLALAPWLLFSGVFTGAVTAEAWVALVFLGLACSGVAYLLWNTSQERHGAHRTGATLYFEPLVTVAVAAWVLGEPVTLLVVAGGAVVLFGVLLVTRGTVRHIAATNGRERDG